MRRPFRARMIAAMHYHNADENGGAGAGALGDDGLPAGDPPAAAAAGETKLGDDGLPLGDDGKPAAAAAEAPKEFVADPNKSPEENEAAKKAFDEDRALNSVPEGEYDFSKFYEEHGLSTDSVNGELVAAFTAEAKEAGLTQKQALAMARVQMKAQADYATRVAEVRKSWLDTAKADETIGRANWTGSIAAGRKAIQEFGSPELSKFFKETGIGGHPEMIRFMSNVGKTLGEGKVDGGGGAATTQSKSTADVFYGG